MTKQDIEKQLEEMGEAIGNAYTALDEAYTPEATRADLVQAVSTALEILEDFIEDEDDEEDEETETDAIAEDDDE